MDPTDHPNPRKAPPYTFFDKEGQPMRIVEHFLWWPKTIAGERRWLRRARWIEKRRLRLKREPEDHWQHLHLVVEEWEPVAWTNASVWPPI